MKWFKRWYRGKFVNRSKCDEKLQSFESINEIGETIITIDGNHKPTSNNNHKPVEMIAATNITPTPSTASFSSFASSTSSSSFVISTDTAAIQATSTTTTTKTISSSSYPNVKSSNQLPSTSKQFDVTKSSSFVDKEYNSDLIKNAQSQVEQCYDSNGSTNVNANGNGENCGGAVQKSKETTRREIIFVRRNCDSDSEETVTGNSINDASGNVKSPFRESLTPNQKVLQRRARELEHFISDISEQSGGDCENTAEENDPKNLGDNCSEEVLQYQSNERRFSDWVVVSIELDQASSCDNQITDEQLTNRIGTQYYSTSEISHIDDNRTIVTLHCNPSTLNIRSDPDGDYGLLHSRGRRFRRFLWLFKLLDFNIKTGSVSADEINEDHQTDQLSTIESEVCTTTKIPLDTSSGGPTQPSCSNIKMGHKDMETFPSAMLLTPDSSLSMTSIRSSESSDHAIILDDYFGLNDAGDIVVHMEHIVVDKGVGYVLRRTKPIYKKVKVGKEMREKRFRIAYTLKCFFQRVFDKVCLRCRHPRNKSNKGDPSDSIGAYALALANDPTSTFSRNIENFISCTKESREVAPQIVMRNMRQFMSGMKNYLVKHGEGDFQREVLKARSLLKPDEFLNLDAILESVMHQLVILPLREHLYGLFVDYYTGSGDIQLLVENVKHAFGKTPVDFGIRSCITPPSATVMQQISLLILRLQEAELPLAKLDYLLTIINTVIDATSHSRGNALGADDFLPLLVYIVAKCGFIGAEIEAEFMWCLLQPSMLSGEAGYYLTALCSAVHVLKSFITSEQDGSGTIDFRSTSMPSCSSVLRVIIPDEYNGSLQTRTLPVRPHTTTRDVCRTIAHKARVTNPQDYGLFKLVDGEETLLLDSECPQEARLAARGKPCMLAYKRIDAKIAWPTTSSAFQ